MMDRLKKIPAIFIWSFILAFCVMGLTGCGTEGKTEIQNGKKSIVCTIFPEYDWTMQVLGEKAEEFEVTLLLDNGADLHNYQPTAEDIARIASCDLFIYVGGESDEWVDGALTEAVNKNMQVINLLEELGDSVKEEELVEGMEGEEEEEGHHAAEEEEEPEYDEHVWLSLKNARLLTNSISEAIRTIDPENAGIYEENTQKYVKELEALDTQYAEATGKGSRHTLLFGDRFPFRYLVDDYGLDYYAAFVGCSAETEASFETITFLAGKVDELGLPYIMVIESSDQKIAQTINANTKEKNHEIMVMNSMQSTTAKDVEAGVRYLDIMRDNLEILRKAVK